MISELTVSIRDEEKTLKKKFLVYQEFRVSQDDEFIQDCITETLKNFSGDPDKISVKINLIIE